MEVARGEGTDSIVGTAYPAEPSLAGTAMRDRRAALADETGRAEPALTPVVADGTWGPAMACPLVGEAGVRGAVVVARYAGSPPFSRTDVEMAEQLALHAALALELADGRRDEARVAMLEDRHRIARDLHDHVIQRIFATELTLEAVTGRATDPAVREALGRAIEDLDETIRRIRTAIFTLQKPKSSLDARAVLLEVVRSSTAALGFEPTLRPRGAGGDRARPSAAPRRHGRAARVADQRRRARECSAVDVQWPSPGCSSRSRSSTTGRRRCRRAPPARRPHRGLDNLASRPGLDTADVHADHDREGNGAAMDRTPVR